MKSKLKVPAKGPAPVRVTVCTSVPMPLVSKFRAVWTVAAVAVSARGVVVRPAKLRV